MKHHVLSLLFNPTAPKFKLLPLLRLDAYNFLEQFVDLCLENFLGA